MVDLRVDAAADAFYAALLADEAAALYERAPCGYLSTTPDGLITKVNATFLTWTGYEREELVGHRHFVDLLTAGGRIFHETHYATSLQMQGTVREIALDIVTSEGGRLPALVNSVLDRADDGTPLVIRTAVFDATQRRRYEQDLVEAKRRAEAAQHEAEAAEARATAVVRALQATMLPPAIPRIPGLTATTAFQPAGVGTELGGDFYDVFEIDEGDWVAVIGDVCGKGIEAAAITTLARHTVRAAAVRTRGAAEILDVVNQVLLHEHTDRYLTAVVVRLRQDGDAWDASFSIGGHPRPYLVRDGRPTPLGTHGTLVGLLDDAAYREETGRLLPGDAMVLYTDGITEARDPQRRFFDDAGLAAVLQRPTPPQDIAALVLAEVLAFQGGAGADDAAVLVLAPDPAG